MDVGNFFDHSPCYYSAKSKMAARNPYMHYKMSSEIDSKVITLAKPVLLSRRRDLVSI